MSVNKEYAIAVCDLANRLINALQPLSDEGFVDYIISEVQDCGYCDIENYSGELETDYDFDDEDDLEVGDE